MSSFTDKADIPIPEELTAIPPRVVVPKIPHIWPARVWREKQLAALAALLISAIYLSAHEIAWSHAQTTSGIITGKGVRPKKGGRSWFVTYAYGANGNQFDAEEGCTEDFFAQAKEGQHVLVRFSGSDDGRDSMLTDSGTVHNDPWYVFAWTIVLGAGLILPIYVVMSFRESKRQQRLIRAGQPAIARVTRITSRSMRPEWPVAFEFQSADGHMRSGASKRNIVDCYDRILKIGSLIVILYDPIKPWRHEVYSAMAYQAGAIPPANPTDS